MVNEKFSYILSVPQNFKVFSYYFIWYPSSHISRSRSDSMYPSIAEPFHLSQFSKSDVTADSVTNSIWPVTSLTSRDSCKTKQYYSNTTSRLRLKTVWEKYSLPFRKSIEYTLNYKIVFHIVFVFTTTIVLLLEVVFPL